jgi:hypothetical protein
MEKYYPTLAATEQRPVTNHYHVHNRNKNHYKITDLGPL